MKFRMLFGIFKERMADANVALVLFISIVMLLVLVIILMRWGSGFLMTLCFIFTGLLLTKSDTLNGLVLMARFPLVISLVFFAFFSRKNRIDFSKAAGVLALLPLVMLINTPRSLVPQDSLGLSILFLLMFIGLILGGQRILGDARGRASFTKSLVTFTIIMTFIQIPFWSSREVLLEGVFETTVGFMLIGMTGVIVLVWFGLKQKVFSLPFISYMLFAAMAFIFLLLTGGRTTLGGAVLGVLVLLARKVRRNVIISLVVCVILAPIGFRIVSSFPGFEIIRAKFFSLKSPARAELYALAWDEIKVNPMIGWGTGMSSYKSQVARGMSYHQSYLEFAVEHGIPFAIVMMLLFLWFPFRGLYLMRKSPTEEMKNMANLSAAILSAYTFSSYLGGVLNSTTFILPVYSAIALQEGVRAESREIELYGWEGEGEEVFWLDGSEEMLISDFDFGTEKTQIYE